MYKAFGNVHKISQVDTIQKRDGSGTLSVQKVVINTKQPTEKYDRLLEISFWNDKVGQLNGLQIGDAVEVDFNLSSKEKQANGRIFYNTSASGITIMKANAGNTAPNAGYGY